MGGVASLVVAFVGLFWFFSARSMMKGFGAITGGGTGIVQVFPLFGLLFSFLALANAVYNFRNATAENRHSLVDITDGEDEPDPLDPRLGRRQQRDRVPDADEALSGYCPYCGRSVDGQFTYCPDCGKRLPGDRFPGDRWPGERN